VKVSIKKGKCPEDWKGASTILVNKGETKTMKTISDSLPGYSLQP
jgi:hypothetical protein